MSKYIYTTQTQLRAAFWAMGMYSPKLNRRGNPLPQNQQDTDCRCAWVDWIDALRKSDEISEKLASHATL